MVGTDRGSRNKDAAARPAPASPANLDGTRACVPWLAENRQLADAVDCREKRYVAGRTKRPCRPNTQLHRGHTGFDSFPDRHCGPGGSKLDGGATHHTQHHALGFRPVFRLVEADAMNGGYLVIVDGAERRYQAWDADIPGILVAPRCARMKPQHVAGKMSRQVERSGAEIVFGWGAARVAGFVPDIPRPIDPDEIVLGQAHVLGCHIGNGKIPFVDLCRRYSSLPVPVVARLPIRQIEFLPDIIATVFPMIVGEGMQDKSVRGVVADRYR